MVNVGLALARVAMQLTLKQLLNKAQDVVLYGKEYAELFKIVYKKEGE